MIKKMCSFVLAFLLFQVSILALNIPEQDESIYVNDYSNVLSEETEKQLISINQTSDYDTGGYVVVATFDFVDEDLYDFSYRLFNEWGIGSKEYNNGVLLVLDIGNDNYCYILGSGIESVLSDSEAWDIIDNYMEPDFAAKDYDQAVLKTTKQFLNVIEDNFVIEDEIIIDNEKEQDIGFGSLFGIAGFFSILAFGFRFIVPIILIILFITVLSSIFRRNRRYGNYHRPMGPIFHRHHDPFAPRPNRNFNNRRYNSFGGGSSFGGSRNSFGGRSSGFGGSRSSSSRSSFGGSRSSHSGGRSRGAGGTRR